MLSRATFVATAPIWRRGHRVRQGYRRERPDALVKAVDFPVNRKMSGQWGN